MRKFLHCTTRQLLLLVIAVSVLLAIVAPRLRDGYVRNRVETATTRLLAAVEADDAEGVERAIAAGADVNPHDLADPAEQPLPIAACNGNLRIVDALLAAGANPNYSGFGSSTPLEHAARNNDVALAKRMLDAGAHYGRALDICLAQGNEDVLKLFLPHSASAGLLYQAIESKLPAEKKLRIVRLLLANGAPQTGRGSAAYTTTPMDQALRNGDAALVDLLREFGAPYTAREAVILNRLDDVRQMLAENSDLVKQRFKAHYHLDNGLDPTLLGLALRHGHREMSQFLLGAGAPLDVREWYHETLMDQAAAGGDPELVRLLYRHGVSVNPEGDYGSPLHTAIWRERQEAAEALLELGADAKRPGLLHAAASHNQPRITRLLLAAGADPQLADDQGRTALEIAKHLGHSEVARLLEAAAQGDEPTQLPSD